MKMYGIPNCSTVKKARAWLEAHDMAYEFHDYKKQGVPVAELQKMMAALTWEVLLNRRGQTWRKLDAATQASVTDAASALTVMQAHPSVIKRPVLARDGQYVVGFAEAQYPAFFGK